MFKNTVAILFALLMFTRPLAAFDFLNNDCDTTSLTDMMLIGDVATMQSNADQSAALLVISQNLLTISMTMMENQSATDLAAISAMLRLSDDIGTMADRIGEMADRILATELQIGIMADRILDTQMLQNQNVALTQANLLKAQENFNTLLIQLAQ
jgi:hypothetical protein